MRGRDPWSRWALIAVAVLISSCASSTAPRGWLPRAELVGAQCYGAWIAATTGSGQQRVRTEGELIAVDRDSVFILTERGLVGLHTHEARRARASVFASETGGMAGWTVFGTLSTASHGIGLVLTAPIWIIAGSISTAAASRAPQVDVPPRAWRDVATYARFPQGLPADLDRSTLEPRPAGR